MVFSLFLSRGGKQTSLPEIGFLTDLEHAPYITGVSGFTHGTGFLDANGFVHYTPDANYFGAVQFLGSIGQNEAANDSVFKRRIAA